MSSTDLVPVLNAVRNQLRSRLEANEATPEDLRTALEEIEVLWEELRAQADTLAEERKRYADFFEHAPDAYAITDPNGIIREANRAAAELFARSQAELAGKSIAAFVAEDAQPQFRAFLVASRGDPAGAGKEWQAPVVAADRRKLVSLRVRAVKVRHKNADALCWLVRPADNPAP